MQPQFGTSATRRALALLTEGYTHDEEPWRTLGTGAKGSRTGSSSRRAMATDATRWVIAVGGLSRAAEAVKTASGLMGARASESSGGTEANHAGNPRLSLGVKVGCVR
jgi:Tfp pilus assembly protein PilW